MKKLILLILLIPGLCLGAEAVKTVAGVADSSVKTVTGKTSADIKTLCGVGYNDGDAGCDTATNEVGDRTEYTGTSYAIASHGLWCWPYTADCTGNVAAAYLYHRGTGAQTAWVGLYSKTDTAPAAADALLSSNSTQISSSTDKEWGTQAVGSYAVSSGTTYWVCVLPSSLSGGWDVYSGTGNSDRYLKDIGQNTLPDNLSTGFTGPADDRMTSVYITIGP